MDDIIIEIQHYIPLQEYQMSNDNYEDLELGLLLYKHVCILINDT